MRCLHFIQCTNSPLRTSPNIRPFCLCIISGAYGMLPYGHAFHYPQTQRPPRVPSLPPRGRWICRRQRRREYTSLTIRYRVRYKGIIINPIFYRQPTTRSHSFLHAGSFHRYRGPPSSRRKAPCSCHAFPYPRTVRPLQNGRFVNRPYRVCATRSMIHERHGYRETGVKL